MEPRRRRIESFQTSGTRRRKHIQSIYDTLDDGYNDAYGKEQREKHDIILRETQIPRSSVCLDLGCGNGILMGRLAHRSRLIVGIDLSSRMVRAAKKKHQRSARCAIVLGDAEYLPFRRHSFQALFAITVVLDPLGVPDTMAEASRVLSNDSIAVFSSIARAEGFNLTESLIEAGFRDWRMRKMSIKGDLGFFIQPPR